jgi:hypothetical protein
VAREVLGSLSFLALLAVLGRSDTIRATHFQPSGEATLPSSAAFLLAFQERAETAQEFSIHRGGIRRPGARPPPNPRDWTTTSEVETQIHPARTTAREPVALTRSGSGLASGGMGGSPPVACPGSRVAGTASRRARSARRKRPSATSGGGGGSRRESRPPRDRWRRAGPGLLDRRVGRGDRAACQRPGFGRRSLASSGGSAPDDGRGPRDAFPARQGSRHRGARRDRRHGRRPSEGSDDLPARRVGERGSCHGPGRRWRRSVHCAPCPSREALPGSGNRPRALSLAARTCRGRCDGTALAAARFGRRASRELRAQRRDLGRDRPQALRPATRRW